jgi:hypothetical protein
MMSCDSSAPPLTKSLAAEKIRAELKDRRYVARPLILDNSNTRKLIQCGLNAGLWVPSPALSRAAGKLRYQPTPLVPSVGEFSIDDSMVWLTLEMNLKLFLIKAITIDPDDKTTAKVDVMLTFDKADLPEALRQCADKGNYILDVP